MDCGLRQAEQKVAPTVVAGGGGAPVQRGESAGEVESAARTVGGLRLKMVDVVLAVLKAEAQRVRALQPAHIAIGDVLIVAEQKRIGYVGIAEVGKGVEDESGKSGL